MADLVSPRQTPLLLPVVPKAEFQLSQALVVSTQTLKSGDYNFQ